MLNRALLLAAAARPPAGGIAFAPTDIAGLALWLDADDPATITKDASNRVSLWADKSDNAAHAVQPNASYQPLYVASAINGRGGVDFMGVDFFNLPDLNGVAASQNRSAFFAFAHHTSTDQGYLIALGHFSTGAAGAAWRIAVHGNDRLQIEITGANYNSSLAPGVLPSQACVILNGTSIGDHTLFLDGIGDSATGGDPVNTGTGEASISQQNRGGPGGFTEDKAFDGCISEIIVYNAALGAANRQKVEGYLAHKWGLVDRLPGNHPYKNSVP